MNKTTEEFFNSHEATRNLVENLNANIEVFLPEFSDDERKALMRMNLIMIRNCLNDFGIE